MKDIKIFVNNPDDKLLEQINEVVSSPALEGQKIRIMPDSHVGTGICIGFTSTFGDYVNPEHIGTDIGCSITSLELSDKIPEDKYAEFERRVRKTIPLGKREINPEVEYDEKELTRFLTSEYKKIQSTFPDLVNHINVIDAARISEFCKRIRIGERDFYKSLGSLGGGED